MALRKTDRTTKTAPSPLQLWREARGLRPVDVAAAAGISAQQVANLEAGRHEPLLETARRIAAVLRKPLHVLFPPLACRVCKGRGRVRRTGRKSWTCPACDGAGRPARGAGAAA